MNRQQRRAAQRKSEGTSPVVMPAADAAFVDAARLHLAGRLAEAEPLLREVLAHNPRHADSLHLLGVSALQAGQPQVAAEMIGQAIAVDGQSAQFHNNLGSALRALDRPLEAASSFRRALAIRPDYPRALINLGCTLASAGRPAEAIDSLRRAAVLAPLDLEACWSLGALLHKQGALDEAADFYERALRIAPGSIEILQNLARLRFAQGRTAETITALSRALASAPASPDDWRRLAIALMSETRISEAAEAYRQAIRYKPDLVAAHNGLASALADLGQLDQAVIAYRQAIRLQPDYLEARSNLLMTLPSLASESAADLLAEARRYAAFVEPRPAPAFANTPDPERTLRVGYVSADFRVHPVGFFLERVLASHDPTQVQAILYSDTLCPDEQTERLRANAQWRPILGMDSADAARLIQADGVDLLIDLTGHTGSNRLPLFGARAAPVQASWLGYFATTGLSSIDYVIVDEVVLPVGEEALFSEHPLRLPGPYLCWTPPDLDVPVGPVPALQQGFVTFGCFNNRRKLNDETLAAWAEILKRVSGSRLFLKSWSLADAGCRQGLVQAFAAHGVAQERLMFEGLSPRGEGLAAYDRVDIALDPFPFGGCTTTADTLWMGVPVVALAGARWSGRMSQTILSSLGLQDWITANIEAYVETAERMANNLPGLATHRRDLRARLEGSAFCDGPGFTRHLEAAYRAMWRSWCGNLAA